MNPIVQQVTDRICKRSAKARESYLARIDKAAASGPSRQALSCANLAHGIAACSSGDKRALVDGPTANIAIISSYNDMLSAHQPFGLFPDVIRKAAHEAGAVAQFAGGVPAMCDGVTQGQPGMELSLFSRDIIAQSTAIALSHDMFDASICLGVCDKIVPGLLIGSLSFGHLPTVFAPAGVVELDVPDATLEQRPGAGPGSADRENGMGRELFDVYRSQASDTEAGGTVLRGLGT